ALSFGGKERFEDMSPGFRIHTTAGVAYGQHYKWTGLDLKVLACILLIQNDVGRFDGQFTSLRHRIPGVNSQVHYHLFDLPRISFDRPQLRFEDGLQHNILSDQTVEHLFHIHDDLVEIQHSWLEDLLA